MWVLLLTFDASGTSTHHMKYFFEGNHAAPRGLDLAPGDYDLYVELIDAQGNELGRNAFAFAIVPPAEEGE